MSHFDLLVCSWTIKHIFLNKKEELTICYYKDWCIFGIITKEKTSNNKKYASRKTNS